jgi:hypothetical protein
MIDKINEYNVKRKAWEHRDERGNLRAKFNSGVIFEEKYRPSLTKIESTIPLTVHLIADSGMAASSWSDNECLISCTKASKTRQGSILRSE